MRHAVDLDACGAAGDTLGPRTQVRPPHARRTQHTLAHSSESLGLTVVAVILLSLSHLADWEARGLGADCAVGAVMIALGLLGLANVLRLAQQQQDVHVLAASTLACDESSPEFVPEIVLQENTVADAVAHELRVPHAHAEETVDEDTDCEASPCPSADVDVAVSPAPLLSRPATQRLLALCVGAVHGVSGVGGVLAVLPALVLRSPSRVAAYLLPLFAATILAMAAFTAAFSEAARRLSAADKRQRVARGIATLSSAGSIAVGIAWLVLVNQEGGLERVGL